MPAHRSSDEADVRNDVVAHIRKNWPGARIIHEINASGQGSNRIDVLAVNEEAILAVEVKSKKDKLTRLPKQVKAMRGVAHYSIAALHEKFLVCYETNKHEAHFTDSDGKHWRNGLPREINRLVGRSWIWPKKRRVIHPDGHDFIEKWSFPKTPMATPLPGTALEILWAAELRTMCFELGIGVSQRTNMSECMRLLRWQCTGKELTRGICTALRRRECIEADPVIERPTPQSEVE